MTHTNKRILKTLDWVIPTLLYQQVIDDPNPDVGLDRQLSPEMIEVLALYEDIKAGRIIATESKP